MKNICATSLIQLCLLHCVCENWSEFIYIYIYKLVPLIGVNSPDHAAMFSTLSAQLAEDVTTHIATLQARDCSTLKTLFTKLLTQLMHNDLFVRGN